MIKVKVLKDDRTMDSVKIIIQSLLNSAGDLTQPQQKFLITLFSTLLISYGRANFTNLGRYSQRNERTYRRQYQRSFNFMKFNQKLIERAIQPQSPVILAVDCSFIPKSGKQTYGIDYFYNGSASRAEKGLEVSAMAVVDVNHKTAYNLSVQQTPTGYSSSEKTEQLETTRIDHYLGQLEATVPYLPNSLSYVVSDGFYSKAKWVNGVTNFKLEAIGKLRRDANLRDLNQEKYLGRGRPRKYAGKVDLSDYTNHNFNLVSQLSSGVYLYTLVVWSISLKRQIRLVYLLNNSTNSHGYAVLFCTNLELNAYTIYLYYKARFQIEFVFRDSKQFTGLADC
ncbi:MAG: transposase, partial [Cyanobacteria bacterium P01_E01_bin.35]